MKFFRFGFYLFFVFHLGFVADSRGACTLADLHAKFRLTVIQKGEIKDGKSILVSDGPLSVAWAGVYVHQSTLRFDIDVFEPAYRYQGLYRFLLSSVLEQYPQITEIPAELPWQFSKNSKEWIRSAFGEYVDLQKAFRQINQLMNSGGIQDRVDWYQKMVQAVFATPMWKVRSSLGFSELDHLCLNVNDGKILLRFKKGDFDSSKLKVYVVYGSPGDLERFSQLLPDGSTKRIAMSEALSLGNYDFIFPMGREE